MAVAQPEQPKIIKLSPEELKTKTLTSHNLQAALEALESDGLVALENAVDTAHLDKLNERMASDAEILWARPNTHVNFNPDCNNIQQEPVPLEGYVFDDVIANPWAAIILESALGPQPQVRLYSANTAFKATGRQPVHIDVENFPRAPHGYCVNINLVSTSPQNGATEFWLGTHNDSRCNLLTVNGTGDDGPDVNVASHKRQERAQNLGVTTGLVDSLVEERRKIRPPIQPSLPKGSVIIRDIRLWHAGMPNKTSDVRIMLVTVAFSKWYRSNQKLVLPNRWKERIQWGRLDPCIEWVDDEQDYLQGKHDIYLSQLP